MREPQRIEVAAPKARHEQIEQRLHLVDDGGHKARLLDYFLRDVALEQAIVFTATKHGADRLASKLYEAGFEAAALHGDMNQGKRNRTLASLRNGRVRVLVATDVAARGIDVASITHVINYDLLKVAEDYVHRIGRTGRAGASGIAISFATRDDHRELRQIERYTGQAIARHVIPGFEPQHAHEKTSDPRRAHQPKRRGSPPHWQARRDNGAAKKRCWA